jgi:signal transduction histidine kinase
LRTLYRLLAWALCGLALSVAATASAVTLESGQHYRALGELVRYEISKSPIDSPVEQVAARIDQHFAHIEGGVIDFGFRDETVWLHLPVRNADDEAHTWILALKTRFKNAMRVYQRTDGKWRLLLSNDEDSVFSERPMDYRLLAVPFDLAAEQAGDLLVGYQSRGTTFLPLTIETPQSFSDGRSLANTRSGGFYTAALLMLFYGLFQFFLPGNRIYLHYSLYLAAAVLYVFHMDGLSFQFLWPNLPAWNAFASLVLGLLINIMAANFSRRFLETWRLAPKLDAMIITMIWLCVALIVAGLLIEDRYVKWLGFWLTSGGAVLYLCAGIYALLQGMRSARFYVVGWIGICTASILSSVIHSLPGTIPVSLSFDITKAGILFDALMFGMAMADRANDIRKQRDQAIMREMHALSEQAKAKRELFAAERGREDAIRMAQETNMQLAAASHDIRQPLSALKLALAGNQAGSVLDSVEYLESLVSNYLDSSREAHPVSDIQSLHENFPIQLVLDGVAQMFATEAQEKGIELRTVPCSMLVRGNPIATVRIVSNLVKNAIKNTSRGKVLLGCRREQGACAVWILDTGRGMTEQELEIALDAFRQVEQEQEQDGHGLGLHIVASLCEKHGYQFAIQSEPGRGTVARVRLCGAV